MIGQSRHQRVPYAGVVTLFDAAQALERPGRLLHTRASGRRYLSYPARASAAAH